MKEGEKIEMAGVNKNENVLKKTSSLKRKLNKVMWPYLKSVSNVETCDAYRESEQENV